MRVTIGSNESGSAVWGYAGAVTTIVIIVAAAIATIRDPRPCSRTPRPLAPSLRLRRDLRRGLRFEHLLTADPGHQHRRLRNPGRRPVHHVTIDDDEVGLLPRLDRAEIVLAEREPRAVEGKALQRLVGDRKSTRLNSSHLGNSYAVF